LKVPWGVGFREKECRRCSRFEQSLSSLRNVTILHHFTLVKRNRSAFLKKATA
jgi:hypothetical protein